MSLNIVDVLDGMLADMNNAVAALRGVLVETERKMKCLEEVSRDKQRRVDEVCHAEEEELQTINEALDVFNKSFEEEQEEEREAVR